MREPWWKVALVLAPFAVFVIALAVTRIISDNGVC